MFISLYLYNTLGAVILMKTAVLHTQGIGCSNFAMRRKAVIGIEVLAFTAALLAFKEFSQQLLAIAGPRWQGRLPAGHSESPLRLSL
jgi:hypothetical protein